MSAPPGLFSTIVDGLRRVWPVFVVIYSAGWTFIVARPDTWVPWFREAVFGQVVPATLLLFCIGGFFLWFSSRSRMLLAAAVVAAVLWMGTAHASFTIVVSFLAARHPRWVRWTIWLGLGVLHPLGLAPDTLGYSQGPESVPAWILPLLAVALPAFIGSWQANAERSRQWQRAEEQARHESTSAREAEALASERLDLSRHMHDIVGRSIARMVLQATAIAATTDDERARELATRISDTGATANEELRTIVHAIGSGDGSSEQPAHEQWRASVDVARTHGHTVVVDGVEVLDAADGPARDAVDAVIGEALHNASKHAPNTTVRVVGTRTDDQLVLTVENDRPSLIRSAKIPGLGIGTALVGAQVRDLGGTLSSRPTIDGGWRVRMEAPR